VVPDGPRLIELVLGYAAATLSTISFAPQAWKVIASRKTQDISLGMYVLTVAAFALWLAFGLIKREWPLVASNGICLLLSGFILVMKILPSSQKKKVAKSLGG
jgi:MtN3 and saliva related transmembrane protein